MTRGKYANKSALRREDAEVRSDIETYQNAVKRLTAENSDLKTELAVAATENAERARQLEAALREGLSPELVALRKEMRRWRDRALTAEGRLSNALRGAE